MKNMTERLAVGGAALVVGLLLGWMVRGVATYNSGAEIGATYDDWHIACPPASAKAQACEMGSTVTDLASGNAVAQIVITKEKEKPVIAFTLPFGVSLQQGVGFVIGKDPVRIIPYRLCNTVGCVATAPLDDKMVSSLSAADDARLVYAGQDGKPIPVAVSLKGYKAARSAYNGSESRRASWFWRLWS